MLCPAELAARARSRNAANPWSVVTIAAVDYRAGRYKSVVDRHLGLAEGPNWMPTYRLFLAMAYQRLGQPGPARQHLLSATEEIRRYLGSDREIPAHGNWHDILRFQILRREAEALILDSAFPADPFAR